jgi:hypothetical protein
MLGESLASWVVPLMDVATAGEVFGSAAPHLI